MEIKDVRKKNFCDIPSPSPRVSCKSCDFWEGGSSLPGKDALVKEEDKKSRIERGIIHAKLLYVNGKAVGYLQYGKLSAFQRLLTWRRRFKNPVPGDAFAITCVSVQREFRRKGVATLLLSSVVDELKSTGIKLLEACVQRPYSDRYSMGPQRLYLKCGFVLSEELSDLSLMRLSL